MVPLIETARGIENCYQAACASTRVVALALGGEDYTANLQCKRTPEGNEIDYARKRIVNAARAASIEVYDTPNTDAHNDNAVKGDSAYAKSLGFTGKLVTANVYGRALTDYEVEQLYNQYNTFDFIPESGYQFDDEEKMLYGIPLTELTAENIENAFANENLYVEADGKIGTGTKIVLKDSKGEIYDTAAVVVFGDVNGDGRYDGIDSVIVNCIANGLLSEKCVGTAVYTAADCNHDGTIDCADVVLLERAGLRLVCVNQCKSPEELMTDSAYVEYLNLIDQTVEDEPTAPEIEPARPEPLIFRIVNAIALVFWSAVNFFTNLFD